MMMMMMMMVMMMMMMMMVMSTNDYGDNNPKEGCISSNVLNVDNVHNE